ncbi:hypothetical protein JW859_03510 [bacterium]|nr:hypothetical protein [bacterium]
MHRIIYALAALAALVGLVLLLPDSQRGPGPATAAGPTAGLEAISPQYAVMAELAPTFIAIQRVQMLNLANGLWLTDGQLDTLIDHLGELKRLENRYGELLPRLRAAQAELSGTRDLLAQLEASLVQGEQPPAALSQQANDAILALMASFAEFDGLEEELNAFKRQTEDAIYEALTDNQRVLVQEYVECIVPPVGDPNNPERIGQAQPEVKAHLAELRALSATQYALAKRHIAEEIWGQILKHFPDQQQGHAAEIARLLGALDQVRALPADEFALVGEELTKLLIPYEQQLPVAVPDGMLINEAEVRARISKFFIENNPLDVLVQLRDNRRAAP